MKKQRLCSILAMVTIFFIGFFLSSFGISFDTLEFWVLGILIICFGLFWKLEEKFTKQGVKNG